MKMNLPNMLIIFRILMIPVFLFFFLGAQAGDSLWPVFRMAAMAVFILAAVTDLLDGHLARKWNTVSNFGTLMDPLADKMLVSSALVALAYRQELAAWVVVVIICREFWVTSLRMLALEQGKKVIAASMWGKIKTVLQVVMLSALMGGLASGEQLGQFFVPLGARLAVVLVYITVFATLVSAVEYTKNNRDVFKA